MDIDEAKIGRYPNIAVAPGTPVGSVKPDVGNSADVDTREKLEADVRQTAFEWSENDSVSEYTLRAILHSLLDRQAAITERELCARCSPYATRKDYLDEITELQAEVDELAAFAEKLETCAASGADVTLFGVDYAPVGSEPFCETVKRWLDGDAPDECRECDDGCWEALHDKLADECDNCEPANGMQAEIDRLRKVVRRQADSFGKLESENAKLRDALQRARDALGNI